jgi:tetratricopeptide (TPR) repeat protein/DNA-binding SARP family transcriptional activator
VDFTLLGDVTAHHNDRSIPLVDMHRKLLAVLLFSPNKLVPKGDAIRLMWGSHADAPLTVDKMVTQYASRLRTALAAADGVKRVVSRSAGVMIEVDLATVDWHVFRGHLERGRLAQRAGDQSVAADELSRGLQLWQGEPLADIRPHLAPIRTEMENRRLEAAELLAGIELDRGDADRVVSLLAGLAHNHLGRDRLIAQLIRALHTTGQRSEAIATYLRSKQFMAKRLGLDPASETEDAYQAVLHSRRVRPSAAAPAGPAQVPRDASHYTGRDAELDQLRCLIPQVEQPPDALAPYQAAGLNTTICAIDGMAGVGKTAFAIHAAHQLAPWFPDAQLFLDLHAHSKNAPRIEPSEALERLLRALGVESAKIPQHLDDRAALYRDRLVGRRVLILLDNAYNADHVRPLIPAASGCLVLITSRRRLTALDDAQPLSLDTLPAADAAALLRSVAGRLRLQGAENAVERIVELCGRLPLAIRIVAARLRTHPVWQPELLAERLSDVRLQLGELDDGERTASAAFTLSYRDLDDEQRRAFRLLGLVPGRDIDTCAAAALIGTTVRRTARLLHDLLDAHLIGEQVEGRYVLHDLMRRYAADQSEAEDAAADRRLALCRWLDQQLQMAKAAMDLLYPPSQERRPRPLDHPVLSIATPLSARGWLDMERANLIAAAGHAIEYGRADFAIALDAVLYRYLLVGSYYLDAYALHEHALYAAQQSGARAAEGIILGHLGNTSRPLGRWEDALDYLRRALVVHEEVGDRNEQAITLRVIGMVLGQHGRYAKAIEYLRQALALARELGNEEHEADTLAAIGNVHFHLGEFAEQVRCYHQARRIVTRIGDRVGEAGLLCNLGALLESRGRYADAIAHYRQALDILTDVGDRAREAIVLSNIGEVHRKQGQHQVAVAEHTQALSIFREIENLPGEGGTLSYLAATYAALGQIEHALDLYEDALAIAHQIGDHTLEAEVLSRLGDACRVHGRSARALTAYLSAHAMAGQIGNPYERARASAGVGLLLAAEGQPWVGHWYLRQALSDFTALRVVEALELAAHLDRFAG